MPRPLQALMQGALLALTCFICIPPAIAADPAKTYQVAIRTTGFLEGISGTVAVGIVYDPAIAESVAAKEAILAQNEGGLKIGQVTVSATAIEISQLASATGVKAIYLTPGLSTRFAAAQAYANSHQVLSIAADTACVKSGQCVVGVETEPSIQVYVNSSAAKAAGVAFQSAFRMMIKEI